MARVENYLNTLIFALVAKTITLIVMVSLFFKALQPFMYFFLTVELGLIIIVSLALVAIVKYEKRMDAERKRINDSIISVSACPDYYQQVIIPSGENAGKTVCNNEFQTSDGKYAYKFIYPSDDIQEKLDSINLDDLALKKKLTDVCGTLSNGVYNNMPWTDLRTKCDVVY